MIMKAFTLALSLAALTTAVPFPNEDLNDGQSPLSLGHQFKHSGLNLDLDAQRLVQFEGGSPVWITELQKVR